MKTKIEQFTAKNPNPVLSVEKDGTVLYSNVAGELLLHEWGVRVGEKLPSFIGDFVQRVISRNSSEKMEVKAGKRVYLVTFHPLPEEKCVNIYGFDISDQKEFEGKLRESENKYRNIVKTSVEGIWIFNSVSETTYVNEKMAEMLGYKPEEMIGRFIWDFAYEEDKGIFQVKLANRKQGIDEVYELKLLRKDGSPLWVSVSAKGFFDDAGKFAGSVGMFTDITRRKQEEHRIRRYNRILEGINRIFSNVVQAKTEEELGEACLSVALEVTGSQFGFINEMGADGLLHDVAKSELGWEQCLMYDKTGHRRPPGDFVVHGLYGSVIINEKSFFANDPQSHPDSIGVPPGHPALTSFLGVPLVQNGKTVGLIAVANRENGYSCEQKEDLEAIAPAVTQALQRKKAEEALRLSNIYNRSLIEASLDPLVTIRPDGKITDVNGAAEQVTGYSRNKLIGTDFSEYFTEPEKARTGYQQVFTYGEVRDYPLEIQHKDGHITPVLYNASVYKDEAGKVTGIFAAARDITAIKKAEEKIQTLANAVESSNDAILTKSLDGIITSWNNGAEKVYGYLAEEVLGKNISIFEPGNNKGETKLLIEKIKQGKRVQHYETLRMKNDGTIINVSITLSPVFDASGKLVAISTIARDITENKKAEEALRLLNLYNRSLIEASLDPLVTIGPDGKITDVNGATEQVTGFSRKYLIGTDFSDYFTEPEEARTGYQQVFANGEVRNYPLEIQHKDGHITPVLYNASVYRDENGKVIGVFAAARDITERQKAEEALRESEKRERARSDELTTVLDAVPVAVFIARDPQVLHITGNRLSYEWLRIPVGTNFSKSAPEGERPEMFNLFKDGVEMQPADMPSQMAAAGIEVNNCELDIVSADGKIRHVLGNARPLRDEQGNLSGSISAFIDITERKKAEEAIRLSNIYNRSLIEASLDPLVTIRPDGKITDVNSATEQVTGYSRNELIGADFSDYFTEPEKASKGYHQVFMHGEVRNYPLEIRHKDGHITPVLYNASVYEDENGEIIGAFAAARDITERKKAEEALKKAHENLEEKVKERTFELGKAYNSLKESENGLSEAQKTAHIGNWDFDLVTGEAYWSDEMYRIFGRNPQELASTYNEFLNFLHPEDRDYMDNAIKKGSKGELIDIDHRIILANGEERTVHAQAKVILDEKNIPIRAKGIIQDITERKKSEEKIQSLANIVESSNDAIVTESLDGIITSWNKEAEHIYGYSAEEIMGKSVSILEPDNLKGEIKKLIEKVKQREKVQHYRTLRLKKDGTIINVSVTYSPVFDASGQLMAISVIGRDITEQTNAQKLLEKAEEARKKEIHHRIKNNLQVISSLLDLQAEKFRNIECVENSEVLSAFGESQDRVMSIALIHEELHEGRGTDTLNFSPYLERLVKNLFQTYRLGNAHTRLNIELEENIFFDTDIAVPLGIIINELVSNSLKHAFIGRDKGEIRIKLHRVEKREYKKEGCKGTSFTLTISDNGVGIPENLDIEDLDSLGLQLITTLVDQLDGELELKKNNGTEFTIRFSIKETDKQIEPDK